MSGIRITRVLGDDWEGVYVDDKLEAEGHSVRSEDWIDIIRKHFHEDLIDEFHEVDLRWLDNRRNLPEKLQDVKYLGD